MSDHLGPELAAEVARRAQHPYARHPAALVLADHEVSRWSRLGTVAHCTCGTNVSCAATGVEYAAHLAEMLDQAGLLKEDDMTCPDCPGFTPDSLGHLYEHLADEHGVPHPSADLDPGEEDQ